MTWRDQLKGDSVLWLLEDDASGVRHLALRDLEDCLESDPEFRAAREAAHRNGPIAGVLGATKESGYWEEPGPGYNPKYRSTVWSITLLAQLGAHASADERVGLACSYILENALTANGQFNMSGTASTTIDCLQGNLCWALLEMGVDDPRIDKAYDWMARSVTGEGIAPMSEKDAPVRYYAGKCGPNFACGANNKLPCAWGAAKVMLAFGKLPQSRATPTIERAIRQGVDFVFRGDPADAPYPTGYAEKPSGNWWKFGFPVFYITDLLQIAEAMVALGYGQDPRLARTLALIRDKQDQDGRWLLEYDYAGKTWGEFGAKKQPNKWVTLRALRVLKGAAEKTESRQNA